MENAAAYLLYLLGALFMTLHFEPEDGRMNMRYLMFVFAWPAMTVWFLIVDLIVPHENDE